MHARSFASLVLAGILFTGGVGAAPLAEGASKFLGNITTKGAVRSDFGTYWNQITAENECKWGSVEGTRGVYNFKGCKDAYDWAKNNGGHFKFHALVWGSQYPTWLPNLSTDETKAAITAWFDAVKTNFPDLEMIDVVNEAVRTGTNTYHSSYEKTKIREALGGDNNGDYAFVTTAFKMARQRWPNAILIYNDYNTFQWQKNEGIDLINKIKAAGAPVDAYGQQAHDMMSQGGGAGGTGASGVCLNYTTFKNTLQEIYDKTKIPLIISEYDIATDDDQIQLQCYKEQITAFMEAPYVAGITLWGYIYGATWTTNGNSGIIKNGYDAQGKELKGTDRPAMAWLKSYLATNKGVNTTGLLGPKPVDTVPQAAYKGVIAVPGTVEIENYDVGGQNQSYYDADTANQGGVYRKDRVDVVGAGSGYAVGYTTAGEWLEYTVNVATAGSYDVAATVASGLDGSSFRLFLDGVAITDTVKVANGGDWTTYTTAKATTKALTAGTHVLKVAITGSYANLDKLVFTKPGTTGIYGAQGAIQGWQDFEIHGMNGVRVGSFRANGLSDLKERMQTANLNRGLYVARPAGAASILIHLEK